MSDNVYYKEGVQAFENRDYENARTLFLKTIKDDPESGEALFYLARTCLMNLEPRNALMVLKNVLTKTQDREQKALALDLMGQAWLALGDIAMAMRLFDDACAQDPACASAWHNMALAHIEAAKRAEDADDMPRLFASAFMALETAMEYCKDDPHLFYSVASWFEARIETLEAAMLDSEQGWAVLPVKDKPDYLLWLHSEANRYYELALAHCRDPLFKEIIQSGFTESLAQTGHHFYRLQQYEAARHVYTRVLQQDPAHFVVTNQIGMTYLRQKQYADARVWFERLAKASPDLDEQADAFLAIAETWRHENNWPKAMGAITEARKRNANENEIQTELQAWRDMNWSASSSVIPLSIFPPAPSGGDMLDVGPVFGCFY